MIDGHGPTRRRAPTGGSRCRLPLMCCKRARPHKGRPTSLIRDIRDRASGGNQMHETSHPSRARPSEPNSTPPTEPAGLLMQPETASAINTGGPLHELSRRPTAPGSGSAGWPRLASALASEYQPLGARLGTSRRSVRGLVALVELVRPQLYPRLHRCCRWRSWGPGCPGVPVPRYPDWPEAGTRSDRSTAPDTGGAASRPTARNPARSCLLYTSDAADEEDSVD